MLFTFCSLVFLGPFVVAAAAVAFCFLLLLETFLGPLGATLVLVL